MNTIITIFKKELIDTLRDRRTLIMMLVIPMLLFPVLMGIVVKVQVKQIKKAEEKRIKIGLLTYGNAQAFRDLLMNREDLRIMEDIQADSIQSLIKKDSLDAVILFSEDFDQKVADLEEGRVELYFKSTEDLNITRGRLRPLINDFEKRLISDRFMKLNLDEKIVEAIHIKEHDIASMKERIGKKIGGFLPYLFVLFCFMGCMYPAIDLGAGEKERGTLETLLSSPASRFQIVMGKFSVVVLAGISAAAISILGLFIAVRQVKELPPELLDVVLGILEFKSIVMVLSLLLTLSIFFAA